MEKGRDNQSLGVILVLLGVYLACKTLGLVQFSIFFHGWWTLFIIVPSLISVIKDRTKASGVIGLIIGCLLLLWQRGIIPWSVVPAVAISFVLVGVGIGIMMGTKQVHIFSHHEHEDKKDHNQEYSNYNYNQSYTGNDHFQSNTTQNKNTQQYHSGTQNQTSQSFSYGPGNGTNNGANGNGYQWNGYNQQTEGQSVQNSYGNHFEACPPSISAILVGKSVNCLRGPFEGTKIQTVLGNVQLDLRQAILPPQTYIQLTMVLGGVDIYLPENVHVVRECQCILGDVRDARKGQETYYEGQPVIHLVGNCVLGGLELK